MAIASTNTLKREDLRRGYELERFDSWLLGKPSQDELDRPARTFRAQTAWCWGVAPPHVLNGEIHHAVIVDGIRIGGMVCPIARTTSYIIAWSWVPYESSQYWAILFRLLPQPSYVICDGQKSLPKALAICWPDTTTQRCRFHAWLNIKTKLTLRPESLAGQKLLKLTRDLPHVRTKRQARRWKRQLKHWYRKHHKFMNQRTVKQAPKPRERSWRYTHERLRSAYSSKMKTLILSLG